MVACNRKQKVDYVPASIYPQVKSIKSNIEGGYGVNVTTGDLITPIINSLGDTLKTGVSIPVKAKVIHHDSVLQPKSFPVPPEDQLTRINNYPKIFKAPDGHTVTIVIDDSLTIVPIIPIEKGDKSHFILNSERDKVPTGIPIQVNEKKAKTNYPRSSLALPLRIKEVATSNVQYLDVDQGMNSSYVLSMLEDRSGNIWFGTHGGGVSRFNGESFSHFTKKEGLSSNTVLSILEDMSGNLWFGTHGGGVSKYDGESFTQFTEKEGLTNNTVMTIFEDKSGNLWFGTESGGVIRYDGEFFTHFTEKEGLSNNSVESIIEDKNGSLWFGTNGGGVSKYDGEFFTHFTEKAGLSNNTVLSILEDKSGSLWFGTNGGGVSKYDGETFSHFTVKEGLSNNIVAAILEDKSGNIWFGTHGGGVNKYDGEYFCHFTEKEGLSNNTVLSILEDSDGNIWFSTFGRGVSKYNGESFSHYTVKDGLSNNTVVSILEGESGNLWFGTYGGGVNRYDGEYFTHFDEKEGLSNNSVVSILKDKSGSLWFGTNGGGVSKYDGEFFTHFTEKEGLSNNFVKSMLEDENGNIWFGTSGGGVSMYDGKSFSHFTEKEGLSNNRVNSIIEDKNGNIWFGTFGGGVSKYDGKTFSHYTEKEGLSNNIVLSILEDKRGNLWFGTIGGGVTKYDGESFKHFTEQGGLSNNNIRSILEDKSGNIWLSTDNGLIQFAYESFNVGETQSMENPLKIHHFEKNDGLMGLDFYTNSAVLDSENRMWWGSGQALTMLDMNNFNKAENPPELYLKGLDINEEFIDYRNVSENLMESIKFETVKKFENYPLNLELDYDQNHLTFRFYSIDWSAPHKIQYSFRLLGQNDIWSNPSPEPKADFRNLGFGDYNFQIRTIGESGEWSEAFEYEFLIYPPWWHTWWARFLYVILSLVLIGMIIHFRTAQLKALQKELEEEVEIATEEIRTQKEEIQQSHKEITDSITCAKRIQNAILPPYTLVKEYLNDSFILYKPKDVVAGDFYWMEIREDLVYFAAADCTGHGVPGAMMSVICVNSLNRSVREFGLTAPAKILDNTRELVIKEFEKSEEDVFDGMDISLCSLNTKTNTLNWAGANNPLWIVRKGAVEIEEIKADKQPIGKFPQEKPFTNHSIQLDAGDTIYLFSDGYQDQFGGERGKKYKSANFKKILFELAQKPIEDQKASLDDEFESWRGQLDQIDDVCVIGVRI